MTPADLTLSTPEATPLAVLPPRRRTGARVEPFISGVTVVKCNKISHPKGPARTILSYPSPSLPLALRTAAHSSIIRRTPPFEAAKERVRYIGSWSFSTWCIARKPFRYNVHMKEQIFLSSLSFGEKIKRVLWGRGKAWAYLSR